MAATTPITWNDPASAYANLAGLVAGADAAGAGGIVVLVQVDMNNPHARGTGSKYRQAKYAILADGDPAGRNVWIDAASGNNLHNAVTGWILPE
ncbi:hypothetical protein B0G81_4337 [Paraburkholderia sp. BL6665CI2N2]|uniref:hypothetical protein n=1 Tax=Paraburkholderia sp. BL6665CI2N2 TaxID=1938806 RepID=UPI0010667516|nr:hypothetical protein [Paraburkholderia sp. BL6665CI2N2]TDY23935.1 hypothetical protein B0G81_4337 [Paraburkholderia sp. BL6665CI2N2]